MKDASREIARTREDQYFLEQEKKRLEEMRRNSAREAETLRLAEAIGIEDRELARELADLGFDADSFRLLYLVPLLQVAWSDGAVSRQETEQIAKVAALHGIEAGSGAYRLRAWLAERPSDKFFDACLRGIKSILQHRSESEAESLRHDLVWYAGRIATASGGFLGMGSRISEEEKQTLARLLEDLDARHHAAVIDLTRKLSD